MDKSGDGQREQVGRNAGVMKEQEMSQQDDRSLSLPCYTRKGKRTVAVRRWSRQQGQVKGCLYAQEMGAGACFKREERVNEKFKTEVVGDRMRGREPPDGRYRSNLGVETELLEGLKLQRRGLIITLTWCFMACQHFPSLLFHYVAYQSLEGAVTISSLHVSQQRFR